MSRIRKQIGDFILWKYERGSLAYDIIVVLILVFIFLVPRACFERRSAFQTKGAEAARASGGAAPVPTKAP